MDSKKSRAWNRLLRSQDTFGQYPTPQNGIARMGRTSKSVRCFKILKGLGREWRETQAIPTPKELGML
jgi:hypothetical protein